MSVNTLPYLIPFVLSMALSLAVGFYAWRHRTVVGASAYAISAFGQAWWTCGYIIELLSPEKGAKLFWDDVQLIGLFMLTATTYIFARQYTAPHVPVNKKVWIGLFIIPVLGFALTITNRWHGLARYEPYMIEGKPFDTMTYDFGLAYWFIILYTIGMSLFSLGMLIRQWFRSQKIFRAQLATIIIGILVPVLFGTLTTTGTVQFAGQRDIQPISFGIGNVIVAWGLFRYRLFAIVPVARDTVVENMRSAVVVIDVENRVVDVNPAAYQLLDQSGAKILGEPLETVFAAWPSVITHCKESGNVHTELTQTIAGNSTSFDLNVSALHDRNNDFIGRLLILRDITEQVQAREAVQKYAGELERANQELKVAWEAAKDADRMKSQFLASMSHELRTPLNAILNFTEFMLMGMLGPVNERQKDAMNKSLNSGKHLLSLINDVLDMTKIQAGMMRLFVEDDVILEQELASVIDATEVLLKGKTVRLIKDIDEGLPVMVGDKRRIRQILLNLLSNAAKFTEQGSITLSVKNTGEDILFAVSDTGPGIAKEDQASIFEAFRQTEKGIQNASGTGLGLPISQRLAEAHGGSLWVESEPGQGATFYVKLPAHSTNLLEMTTTTEEFVHV